MRRDNTELATAAVAAACSAGAAVPGLRVVAGLLLVLVLPGYALSALVVPAAPAGLMRVSPVLWRGMWAVGLSLAVAVLGGLLLNLTPLGLTRMSWAVSLAAVTLLAVAASAWRRRRAMQPRGSAAATPATPAAPGRPRFSRIAAGYALAAVALAAAAIMLAVLSAGRQHSPGFAQLWLVPARSPAVSGQATLGVRSGYQGTETFHLVLRRGPHPIGTWDFTLGPGRNWQRTVTAPVGQHLTAQLSGVGQRAATETVTITSS